MGTTNRKGETTLLKTLHGAMSDAQLTSKRQRLSPKMQESAPLDDPLESSREELIARLLNERKDRIASPASPSYPYPLVRDEEQGQRAVAGTSAPFPRPNFELPSFEGSASLLARVQNFLPQLQQANAGLKDLEGVGQGFELIDKDAEDSGSEIDDDDREILTKERPIDEDEDDEETGQGEDEVDRQIVIDLALGVLEQKQHAQEDDTTDSSDDGDESDESSGDSSSDSDGSASTGDDGGSAEASMRHNAAVEGDGVHARPQALTSEGESGGTTSTPGRRKPLIEELS